MKALIQKLPLSEDTSFVARIYRTPHFEVPWHQHAEFELILFLEGSGLSFAGNYVGDFKAGDIFFLGSNLPHTFQNDPSIITSAMVVQFKRDFCGDAFFDIAENQQLKNMLERSSTGFKIIDDTRNLLAPMVEALGSDQGFRRIMNLLECLNIISESKDLVPLSTQEAKESNVKDRERIDRIFQYTMDNFKEGIQLETIADVANMSVPAFCNYFKKRTKKTYIDFVNEIRIGYACQLLLNTEMSVMEACYESGYNTIANFNKQFIKTKGLTPTKYRTAVSCSKSRVFDADILNTSDIRGLQHVVADMF